MSQIIPSGSLFCIAIQRNQAKVLESGNQCYSAPCPLSMAAKEELNWERDQLTSWIGKRLVLRKPEIQIETDASISGWRASCQGTRKGGCWFREEKCLHINFLELLASTLAMKTFLIDQVDKRVLLYTSRQSNSSSIHQQSRWNSLRPIIKVSQKAIDVVSREIHVYTLDSTAPSWEGKCQCRHKVKSDEGSLQLDAELFDFSMGSGPFPMAGGRFICNKTDLPTTPLLQV